MTQHKVIAEDSLSAMDEISRVLGKEAVILNTQKVNGKIEIIGSNNIEDIEYFLNNFPNSAYVLPAKLKLKQLKRNEK